MASQSSSQCINMVPLTQITMASSGSSHSPLSSQTSTPSPSLPQSQLSQSQTPVKNPVVILDKVRLQELVQEVDPNEQLDDDVEEMLLGIADDFIESLVSTSAMIAKHRKSATLDVKDVQIALEKNWNIWIPGFGTDDARPPKKLMTTEAHKQRMALIRKTIKKN